MVSAPGYLSLNRAHQRITFHQLEENHTKNNTIDMFKKNHYALFPNTDIHTMPDHVSCRFSRLVIGNCRPSVLFIAVGR